ncbi:helicase [Tanacetum coccineum]
MAKAFGMAQNWCHAHNSVNFELHLLSERKTSARQYNTSTVSEVVALITNDFGDGIATTDIVRLYTRGRSLKKNSFTKEALKKPRGQKLHDRPEVGTRVFKMKLTELLDDLTKREIFGKSRAEISCPKDDPEGYKVVTEFMLQGPCGKGDACGKFKGKFTYDNKYVVPYNRYLLLRYQAHINVEWCNRSMEIKYLFKYLNKGPDRATIVIQENVQKLANEAAGKVVEVDEIKNYLNCRYLALIASLLLPGGRTAHCRFVIPLELMENSTYGIKQNTHLAELMQQVQLIIWDEAPMTQKFAFEALDKTLRDNWDLNA